MIDLGLDNKRILISGAGYIPTRAGHGRHSALKLAAAGARLACIDIDEGRAHAIAAEVESQGGQAFPVVADMEDTAQVERAIDEAIAGLGGLDGCVDIIGGASWDAGIDTTNEAWDQTLLHNLTQVFYLLRAVGKRLIEQGTGGSIVALSSVDATVSATLHGPYGAAKAGVISLMKTFADELGRHGIRVNCVAPGNVGGGKVDQGEGVYGVNGINPLAAPRATDVANAVLFLSSELSARITGQTLIVDGGATIQGLWGVTDAHLPALHAGAPAPFLPD